MGVEVQERLSERTGQDRMSTDRTYHLKDGGNRQRRTCQRWDLKFLMLWASSRMRKNHYIDRQTHISSDRSRVSLCPWHSAYDSVG